MRRCVDSILPAGEAAEILIINDGSADETGAIADQYALTHPSIVRALHFENGGPGEAINRGISAARGEYFKVVDSDDFLDPQSLSLLMTRLCAGELSADVIVADYVRVRDGTARRRRMSYRSAFPQNRAFTFDEIRYLGCYQNLFIHSLIYKTALVRESALALPKHTFYVDCLYSNVPLYFAKTFYYLRAPLYSYVIGRAGQSVDRAFMNRNIEQMISVCDLMIDYYLNNALPLHKKQRKMLLDDISFIITIFSTHLVMEGSPRSLARRHEFWRALRARDPAFAARMRKNPFGYIVGARTDRLNPMISSGYRLINRAYIVD
jgi:glycosyltransferase involved in cell wall biosynthesis